VYTYVLVLLPIHRIPDSFSIVTDRVCVLIYISKLTMDTLLTVLRLAAGLKNTYLRGFGPLKALLSLHQIYQTSSMTFIPVPTSLIFLIGGIQPFACYITLLIDRLIFVLLPQPQP
jgi:hypothetical protein